MESSSESPSPKSRVLPGFKIDPLETEPMINKSCADLFGPQLNLITNKETIIEEDGFALKDKRLLILFKFTCLFGLMYIFICSLELMSIAFRLIGGKNASSFFSKSELISNPIVGLMLGILVTVLVQSSSTSTSIVVTMVSSDMIKVHNAIPIVMGANVGTSITNTIVSFMQVNNREEFQRAFAAATVHDIFNFLSVSVLLPLECLTGYLEFVTNQMILAIDFKNQTTHKQTKKPFIKQITSPLINSIIRIDNHLLEKVRNTNSSSDDNVSLIIKCCEKVPEIDLNKSEINCIQSCYSFFNFIGLRDWVSGIILLILTIFLLCVCLIMVVKILNSMLKGKIASIIKNYINTEHKRPWSYLAGYFALLIGCAMTILLQSSSIFTSTLTPLAGLGIISLERIYPLTLGSNIGTTTTSVFAALTADQRKIKETLQLSFCHLIFNISGIILFYPIPFLRFPITIARKLGLITATYRWFSIVYLLFFFFLLPLMVFGLSLAGYLVFITVMIMVILILILIALINLLQLKSPTVLPIQLRNWSFLPIWLTSLEPYDVLILKLAKKIPFLFLCVQSEARHDLIMTSVLLSHNANSQLHILENSRNNSSSEFNSILNQSRNQSRRSSYLTDYNKPKFDLDDSYFY